MGKVNFGFTPDFQRILTSMGIDFNAMRTSMDQQSSSIQTSWDPKIDLQAPYFRLKRSGIETEGHFISDPRTIAKVQSRKKQGLINADVQKLYDQVLKMREVEAARGAPPTAPKQAWWQKALDIISRPGRGVTTGMFYGNKGVEEAEKAGRSFAGFRGFDEFTEGFKKGFTGKEHKTGTDILREQVGVKNKAALFAGGLAIDIFADPLSYVGFGVGKKLVQEGSKKVAARKVAEDFATPAFDVSKIEKILGSDITKTLSPTAKAKITRSGVIDIGKLTTVLGSQASKAAQLGIADDLTKLGFDTADALKSAKKWLNPKYADDVGVQNEKNLFGDLIKTLPGLQSAKHLDTTFAKVFSETKDTATKQLTEVLNANMEQQVKRTLEVKALGIEAPIAPIPQVTIKALSVVAKTPILDKAIIGFNKTFNTGSRFDHDLYVTKSRAAGKAEQRINMGQQMLVRTFQGISKERRVGWMRSLVTNPNNYGRGVLRTADDKDMGDFAYETFGHLGTFIDWTGKGAGIVSLQKLNSYLPHKYQFDTSVLQTQKQIFNPAQNKGAQNFLNLLAYHKEHFASVDPQDLLYHLHIGIEKSLAREQFMRAIADLGVPVKANHLTTDPVLKDSIKQGSGAVSKLISEHGYGPIITKSTRELEREVDPSWARHLKDRVFHPDVKAGLIPMLRMMEDEKSVEGISRFYDRALSYFKKAVTLPMPSYHIRNSFGDLLTSYTDGVQGARGLASYAQASKVMRFINPLSKNDEIQKILTAPVTPAGQIEDPLQQIAKLLQGGRTSVSGNLVMKKNPKWKDIPGKYVSAEQFMAAYQHMGLKRGFVSSDLERELRGNPNLAMKALHLPMDQVVKLSQQREDYFRMAHFIDRIKRSRAATFEEAAQEAAYYVKKFHFDYTDVTPTERAYFSRAIPFYKFQRFATPLMLQMFFANPGKLLNAQKVMNNMAYAQGYTNDGGLLPTADMIMPEYMRDAMMIPLFNDKGSTVYFGSGVLPSTSIFSQTLGLESSNPRGVAGSMGQNIMQNLTPAAQIPFEGYFGKRVFGKGKIPVQTKEGSYLPYIMSKTPISNFGYQVGQGEGGPDITRILNIASGLGLSANTPARQKSELYRERDIITRQRQQSGYKAPKKTSGRYESGRKEPGTK